MNPCNMTIFNYDKNKCANTVGRMRGMGSSVPKKVTGKYIYTLESINKANSLTRSSNILLIHDYSAVNDANLLHSQLLSLQTESGFLSFRQSVGYPHTIDMNLFDAKNTPNGKITIKAVKNKIDTLGNDLQYVTTYVPYTGSDITVQNYGIVVLFTKILPFVDGQTGETIDITQYDPALGYNLQNYINNGGNIILSNNVWQNAQIPNFYYSYTPFLYSKDYTYSPSIKLNNINFVIPRNPILKGCSNNISLFLPQKILETVYLAPGSELIANITYNNKEVPFLASYMSNLGGRSVALNCYVGAVSNDRANNLELAKIIYNSIYWCFKINV